MADIKKSTKIEKVEKRISIDGNNKLLGRIGSIASKYALMGYHVDIYNCDNIVISGKRVSVSKEFKHWLDSKDTFKGHFIPRIPHYFVKRLIRGMLPFKTTRGREAYSRILCYRSSPVTDVKFLDTKTADVSKLSLPKYVTIKDLVLHLGGKA